MRWTSRPADRLLTEGEWVGPLTEGGMGTEELWEPSDAPQRPLSISPSMLHLSILPWIPSSLHRCYPSIHPSQPTHTLTGACGTRARSSMQACTHACKHTHPRTHTHSHTLTHTLTRYTSSKPHMDAPLSLSPPCPHSLPAESLNCGKLQCLFLFPLRWSAAWTFAIHQHNFVYSFIYFYFFVGPVLLLLSTPPLEVERGRESPVELWWRTKQSAHPTRPNLAFTSPVWHSASYSRPPATLPSRQPLPQSPWVHAAYAPTATHPQTNGMQTQTRPARIL